MVDILPLEHPPYRIVEPRELSLDRTAVGTREERTAVSSLSHE